MLHFLKDHARNAAMLCAVAGASLLFLSVAAQNFSLVPENLRTNAGFAAGCFLIAVSLLSTVLLLLFYTCRKGGAAWMLLLLHTGLLVLAASEIVNLYAGKNLILFAKEGMRVQRAFAADESVVDLPFSLELNAFSVDLSAEGGKVANYVSDVVLKSLQNKNSVKTTVSVNHPVSFEEWNIYQYDAGLDDVSNSTVKVELESGKNKKTLSLRLGERRDLSDGSLIAISDFAPALFQREGSDRLYVQKINMMVNPAYLFEYTNVQGKTEKHWVWTRKGLTRIGNMYVRIIDHLNIEYAVFSVTHKPARDFSYLGMILASLGLSGFVLKKGSSRHAL